MLLDEPTNHLDLPMLDWLENTIAEMEDTALVVVSHDRYFLDSVADEIFDMVDGKIERYIGNYSAYTDLKAHRQLSQQRAYDQQQAFIAKEEEYIRRFGANQRARQARGRKKRLDRLKAGGSSGLVETTKLVQAVRRDGRPVTLNLEVKKPPASTSSNQPPLQSYPTNRSSMMSRSTSPRQTRRHHRPNGSGKSTLLNILAGENTQDSGDFKVGHGVKLEFFRQEHQTLNLENNIIEEFQSAKITATSRKCATSRAAAVLGDTTDKKVGVLSGGERARVPWQNDPQSLQHDLHGRTTNHLDMPTCEVLETASRPMTARCC